MRLTGASFSAIGVQVDVADDGSFLLVLQGYGYSEGRRFTAAAVPVGAPFVLFSGENGGNATGALLSPVATGPPEDR